MPHGMKRISTSEETAANFFDPSFQIHFMDLLLYRSKRSAYLYGLLERYLALTKEQFLQFTSC